MSTEIDQIIISLGFSSAISALEVHSGQRPVISLTKIIMGLGRQVPSIETTMAIVGST